MGVAAKAVWASVTSLASLVMQYSALGDGVGHTQGPRCPPDNNMQPQDAPQCQYDIVNRFLFFIDLHSANSIKLARFYGRPSFHENRPVRVRFPAVDFPCCSSILEGNGKRKGLVYYARSGCRPHCPLESFQ